MAKEFGAPGALTSLGGVLCLAIVISIGGAMLSFGSGGSAAVGVILLILASAFATGAFLGFLFGVPRVLSKEGATVSALAAAGSEPAGATSGSPRNPISPVLQSNTNLERISDWLTTMIVGATLVELHKLNDYLIGFREFLAASAQVFIVNGVATAGVLPAVGPIAMIFGAVTGFLYMYLNTRLFLTRMFAELERFLQHGPEQRLSATEASMVAEAAATNNPGTFVRNQLARVGGMSVRDALQQMRSALYKVGGYKTTIKIGDSLAGTTATQNGEFWFLMAAAFGQSYQVEAKAGDKTETKAARDNALDAARQAIACQPYYRGRLRALTDPKGADNDLAELYANDPELKVLLDDR